jgi:hypothetical protein
VALQEQVSPANRFIRICRITATAKSTESQSGDLFFCATKTQLVAARTATSAVAIQEKPCTGRSMSGIANSSLPALKLSSVLPEGELIEIHRLTSANIERVIGDLIDFFIMPPPLF